MERTAGRNNENNREETGLASEISKSYIYQNKYTTTRPCYVLLKDIRYKMKENQERLRPNGKKVSRPKQTAVFKNPHIVLYDMLAKSDITIEKNPPGVENMEGFLEKGRETPPQRGPSEGRSGKSDAEETNPDCNVGKSENRAESSEILLLSDQGRFARVFLMESIPGNSGELVDPCPIHKDETGMSNLQKGFIPASGTQQLNTECFEQTEFLGYGSQEAEETERDNTGYKTEKYQTVEASFFTIASVTPSINGTQHNSVSSLLVSEKEILQREEIGSASDISHEGVHGRSRECELVSSFSRISLEFGLKEVTPSMTEGTMRVEERRGPSFKPSVNKLSADQTGLEEQDPPPSQSNSLSLTSIQSMESPCFLPKVDEDLEGDRDAPDPGVELQLLGTSSASASLPDDNLVSIPSEIGKDATSSCFFSSEEDKIPQPAVENNGSTGELSESFIRLLGTARVNQETFQWGKLAELEDSSNDEGNGGSYTRRSSNSKNEDRLYLANKATHLEESRIQRRVTRGPKKTPNPVHGSWLSPEQKRLKVIDALEASFQKRLSESPELDVAKRTVSRIAKQVEKALFRHFCCVDWRYKNKFRSLLFNLKSAENQLFHNLMLGKITPKRLVQMSSLEMAPKRLAEWRAEENKRVLAMIEKEAREAPRRCSEKLTHKGLVEICREADGDLIFEEITESSPPRDGETHQGALSTVSSQKEDLGADSERGQKLPTSEFPSSQKARASEILRRDITRSELGRRPLSGERSCFPRVRNKKQRVTKQSRSSVIWNGVIQMFSGKQFVAKAYPVSGFGGHLSQTLPVLLQSKGCILPDDVWTYLDSLWPTHSKEMGMIQFHPSLSKDVNPYNRLYAYLNSKQRYGIVDSSQMEIFLVPLPAYQLVPSKLHSIGGPGLDPCHPSLLLGLLLPKRTHQGALRTSPDRFPRAKKKRVSFADSVETFSFPLRLPEDAGQEQPPQQPVTEGLPTMEGLKAGLTADHLHLLVEQLQKENLWGEPSSLCQPGAPDASGETLQATTDSSLSAKHLGSWTAESCGAQTCQGGDDQFGADWDPSDFISDLGLLLPLELFYPDQPGADATGGQGQNASAALLLPAVLCAETVPPSEGSQVHPSLQRPCPRVSAGEHNSPVQETLLLIQQVAELQSHLQGQEPTMQDLSQIPTGAELLWVQPSDATKAQPEVLLSPFRK